RRAHLFVPPLPVGVPFGGKSFYLDLNALQRLGLLGPADGICPRLHWLVRDRWPHGALPRVSRLGHSHSRHLFCRRPLPLHHGRRRGYGLCGRLALLVAEDYRQALSEIALSVCRDYSLC